MATVAAISSFAGWLKRDELGPRPKDAKGKTVGEDHGIADGLPAPGQTVKDGEKFHAFQGQLFDDNHPAVKRWPTMFGKPDTVVRTVEQATAAPGEKR